MILSLDFSSEIPIYLQIRNQIVLGVADGSLKPGEKLPTIRALADESGVNTMTVNKAYSLLKQEGVIIADRRSGAHIREPEPDRKKTGLDEASQMRLKLVIAEAKLSGMTRDDFLELCAVYFGDQEGAE